MEAVLVVRFNSCHSCRLTEMTRCRKIGLACPAQLSVSVMYVSCGSEFNYRLDPFWAQHFADIRILLRHKNLQSQQKTIKCTLKSKKNQKEASLFAPVVMIIKNLFDENSVFFSNLALITSEMNLGRHFESYGEI